MADTPDRAVADGEPLEPVVSEIEQATAWLEKVTRDPMADAVTGRARVEDASDPVGPARYQECEVTLTVEAPGIPPTSVRMSLVFPRRVWPRVGDVLPARISASDPTVAEVDWDRLRNR